MLRITFGSFLLAGGICGVGITAFGSIVVTSTMAIINGLDISIGLSLFSVVVFLSGLYVLVSD